tara:strand:+ start:808 stop:993 length:186 start_codon:yes stop_codon:yes gene_type:complete
MDKQQYKELVANLMRKESIMKDKIQEAIKTLTMYDRNCKISMNMAMGHCKKLLKQSLDLDE